MALLSEQVRRLSCVGLAMLLAAPAVAGPRAKGRPPRAPPVSAPIDAAAAAAAAPAEPAPADRAYQLFVEAEKAYGDGQVERAVALLQQAWELSPEPVLLYNLARAYETLGQLEAAVEAYRRYLKADPSADGKGAISFRIASLEKQLAERQRLEHEREAAQVEAKRAKSGAPGFVWPLTVGGAGLLAGGVLKGVAFRERDLAQAEPVQDDALKRFRGAQTLDTASTIAFVAGGVVAAAGLTWAVISLARAPKATVQVVLGPGSVGVVLAVP